MFRVPRLKADMSRGCCRYVVQVRRNGQLKADRFRDIIGNVLSSVRASCSGKNPRIAAFGEMVALLWAMARPNRRAAGTILERPSQTHSFHLRCAYPIGDSIKHGDAGPFRQICSGALSCHPYRGYTSLPTDADRLRTISELQQKALASDGDAGTQKDRASFA